MVWKKTKRYTSEDAKAISKTAVKKKFIPMFSKSHTRKSADLNLRDYKKTTEKKLTKDQEDLYNQMLEEERIKNDPLRVKSNKVKSR